MKTKNIKPFIHEKVKINIGNKSIKGTIFMSDNNTILIHTKDKTIAIGNRNIKSIKRCLF